MGTNVEYDVWKNVFKRFVTDDRFFAGHMLYTIPAYTIKNRDYELNHK